MKRKRIVLSIEDKLQICKLAKEGRSLASLAVDYGVGKSTVPSQVGEFPERS